MVTPTSFPPPLYPLHPYTPPSLHPSTLAYNYVISQERQKNKDSPYNFNNPPQTTLNLEEYEKTGKFSEKPATSQEHRADDTTINHTDTLHEEKNDNNSTVKQKKLLASSDGGYHIPEVMQLFDRNRLNARPILLGRIHRVQKMVIND